MSAHNIHTIYGHRIPYAVCHDSGGWLPELDILCVEINVDQIEELKNLAAVSNILPTLNIDAILEGKVDCEKLKQQVSQLFDQGFSKIALSVDEDSAAIKSLSPRFSDEDSRKRAQEQIGNAFRNCAALGPTLVALTVEELCPGGLDPTDGIALAHHFVACGASGIIASGGTQDFLPLKMRRPTSLKEGTKAEHWPETWLSSALWLVGKVDMPIYAQGHVTHREETLAFATSAGLSGIINK